MLLASFFMRLNRGSYLKSSSQTLSLRRRLAWRAEDALGKIHGVQGKSTQPLDVASRAPLFAPPGRRRLSLQQEDDIGGFYLQLPVRQMRTFRAGPYDLISET